MRKGHPPKTAYQMTTFRNGSQTPLCRGHLFHFFAELQRELLPNRHIVVSALWCRLPGEHDWREAVGAQ